jgi:hypothetical protein
MRSSFPRLRSSSRASFSQRPRVSSVQDEMPRPEPHTVGVGRREAFGAHLVDELVLADA